MSDPDVSKKSTEKDVGKPDSRKRKSVRPTKIEELDKILDGGLPSDSVVLLSGSAGAGKTILAMQWLFAGINEAEEPGLYLSMTEPVNKIIRNVEKFSFCDRENISVGKVHIEDLRNMMNASDLYGKSIGKKEIDLIIDQIVELVQLTKAKRVVIDSITAMGHILQDDHLIRRFVYHLDALVSMTDINIVLTSEVAGEGNSVFEVEEFVADGIIKLTKERSGTMTARKLQVVKMRGSNFDGRMHLYKITSDGFIIYPKRRRKLSYNVATTKVATGIEGLDNMTMGGVFQGSITLITGSSGSGKTLMSMQLLLQRLKEGEKSILFAFEESRDQILRNALTFGWDLKEYEDKGLFKVLTRYSSEKFIDEHEYDILREVDEFQPAMVAVDSLTALDNIFGTDAIRDFALNINSYLKNKLVTTIYTHTASALMGASKITDQHISSLTDNIFMLRYVEIDSELRHALLILKYRGSEHDKKLRELTFTTKGLHIASDFAGFEAVLTGTARKANFEKNIKNMVPEMSDGGLDEN